MTEPRPFKILGVQQIAIGGLDKQPLHEFWVDVMGLSYTHSYTSDDENVDEDICKAGTGTLAVEVDLMQPIDAARKPKVHEPPLNHVGLWIDDLPKAFDWLTSRGVRFTPGGIRKGASGYDICFIHPKGNDQFPVGAVGVLIELVQAPTEVRQAFAKLVAT